MKQLFLLPFLAIMTFAPPATLSKKERKFAKDHLKETKKDYIKTLSNLSEAQLKFKPAPDRWSVEECAMHIAVSEKMMWQMVEDGLKQPANPEMRSEIKMTDEQLIGAVQSRAQKFKAPEVIQPQNSNLKSAAEAMSIFKETRDKAIALINSTGEDMRNHVLKSPLGVLDTYQVVLLMSAHSNRHTQQMKEVMADPNFPKN